MKGSDPWDEEEMRQAPGLSHASAWGKFLGLAGKTEPPWAPAASLSAGEGAGGMGSPHHLLEAAGF